MNRNKSNNGLLFPVTGSRTVLNIFVPVLLAAFFWSGCKQSQPPVTPGTASADTNAPVYALPTQAQAKLPTMKIFLGPETLDAEMAVTPSEETTGLMYRTNITDDTAMLFVLEAPMAAPNGFWMTNCPISLSAAYIGPDGVIEEIHHLEKNDNKPVVASNDNIVYVLEVNDGWFTRHNISPGTLIRTERGTLSQTFSQR